MTVQSERDTNNQQLPYFNSAAAADKFFYDVIISKSKWPLASSESQLGRGQEEFGWKKNDTPADLSDTFSIYWFIIQIKLLVLLQLHVFSLFLSACFLVFVCLLNATNEKPFITCLSVKAQDKN